MDVSEPGMPERVSEAVLLSCLRAKLLLILCMLCVTCVTHFSVPLT